MCDIDILVGFLKKKVVNVFGLVVVGLIVRQVRMKNQHDSCVTGCVFLLI